MDFYRIATPEGERSTVTLYHGTVLAYAKNIIKKGIKVDKNRGRELDFGMGLYFSDFRMAKRWAKKKAKDNMKDHRTGEHIVPVVIPLEVDIGYILNHEEILIFTRKDRKWLDFVFRCRENKDIPYGHDAAVIIGPMADGAVDNVMGIYRRHPKKFVKPIVFVNFLLFSGFARMQYVVKKQYLCDNGHIKVVPTIIYERRPPYDQQEEAEED